MVIQEEEIRTGKVDIPEEIPVLPSGGNILYPSIIVPVTTGEPKIVQLIDEAVADHRIVGLFAERDKDNPDPDNLYRIGTAALVARMFKWPDGSIQAFLRGLARIELKEITQYEPYLKGTIQVDEDIVQETPELEALTRNLVGLFQRLVELAPNLPQEVGASVLNIPKPGNLADFIAAHINLSTEEGQDILETLSVVERIKKLSSHLNRELELLELGSKIQTQIKGEMDKAQREYYLREQMKAIQNELGESDERTMEINEFKEKIEEAQLPDEAMKEAERELERLGKMHPAAAEYMVSRTYLDWLVSLPWAKSTQDSIDIAQAAQVLDEDHYDLVKVKDRILDFLAVHKLREDMRGPILCFVGPPGTGKTSVGHSIARALGRKFVRISLGGVRDEAEIRGHRRTYVGALPGRIIQGIRRAESNNPVFMLDEIDKLGADFRGDPSAALLEVLDPAQNFAFVDHYLDVPFDFSRVLFITTANMTDPIPPALKDRMEVIELVGYTEQEKLHIAENFLIPRQLEENGLTADKMELTEDDLRTIIRKYTREAGVRNLEREIGTVCRKVARGVAEGALGTTVVTPEKLRTYLGPETSTYEQAGETDEVGVATGLAWTQTGGDVLFVEASLMPGKGNLILTGKLGDVMQESATATLTYIRSRAASLGIAPDFYEMNDVHIHVPAGAVPKDGPSAGITMAVAMASALTQHAVSKDIAMTGEVTLRGKILPVGGIKDKVLAAHRAGIQEVLLPKENEKDLEEVPQQVKDELKFEFIEYLDQALEKTVHPVPLKKTKGRRRATQLQVDSQAG